LRVLVTGATGFVGSHTAAALCHAGHEVRVLARNPSRVSPALNPHGVTAEIVVGDMTDSAAVGSAVAGCDAVIHAAGEIGVDSGTGPVASVNLDGARTVIACALDAGADPVVYTSSVTAYLPTDDDILTAESALVSSGSSYGASKVAVEHLVREWQAQGAPVTSIVLGGVYGPICPHLNGSFAAILGALESMMLVPPGGLGVIDVRDVAALLTAAVEPGRGARRYLAGGHFLTWTEWTRALSEAAGREVAQQAVSADELLDLGRTCDRMRAEGKGSLPLSEEAAIIMLSGVPTDDSATLADLGCAYRDYIETFADTVRYLHSIGRLPNEPGA
jgi:dihydroflavonol-4-reductase